MKNIRIEKLSNAYTIRCLMDADVPMLYAWMLRNDQYFRYCGGNRILHTPPPLCILYRKGGLFMAVYQNGIDVSRY